MSEAKIVNSPSFPELVRQFFVDYLLNQRAISPNTIASYRDAMLLFLDFAHEHLGKAPSALRLVDISPDLLLTFLDDLEQRRGKGRKQRAVPLWAATTREARAWLRSNPALRG
jgi:site-specific recombinase XerD